MSPPCLRRDRCRRCRRRVRRRPLIDVVVVLVPAAVVVVAIAVSVGALARSPAATTTSSSPGRYLPAVQAASFASFGLQARRRQRRRHHHHTHRPTEKNGDDGDIMVDERDKDRDGDMSAFVGEASELASSYASSNGIQIASRGDGGKKFECAPISLLPSAFPKYSFVRAKQLAGPLNELVDMISRDGRFLTEALVDSGVTDSDPYTANLVLMYCRLYMSGGDGEDGGKKKNFAPLADRLGIHRSDYMLTKGRYTPKQIELNTIASSFASLSSRLPSLHNVIVKRYGGNPAVRSFMERNDGILRDSCRSDNQDPDDDDQQVRDEVDKIRDKFVPSDALGGISKGLALAHQRYCTRFQPTKDDDNNGPHILFVVQEGETNTIDQRLLEISLMEEHGVAVTRMSLTKLFTNSRVDPNTGALYIVSRRDDGVASETEVSVVYYRAGYAPTDYPSGDGTPETILDDDENAVGNDDDAVEWRARYRLERSRSTKCPSLGYHLAGTKKVQQRLARLGALERFFPDRPDTVKKIRSVFAGLYSLGQSDMTDGDRDVVRSIVLDKSDGVASRYVLKPQREGGGYNLYGSDLAEKLRRHVTVAEDDDNTLTVDHKVLGEYILMDRLFPPEQYGVLLRSGVVEGTGPTVSEFGCYGTILSSCDDGEPALHNDYAGYLLRTKFSDVDEGGVASGFATLSSVYFV